MNEHDAINEKLAYYRDLDAAERRSVAAHVAGCEACRETLAAYEGQDRALRAMPLLRARQRWHPPAPAGARQALARLGEALVLGGVGAMLWLLVLQLQSGFAGTGQPSGVPASTVLEPGLALPPTVVHLPSPWLPALPWVAGALIVVGLLFALSRRNRTPAVTGAILVAILLTGFIPPLSAFPNPVGFFWRVAGGYSYDPNLPFRNDFVIAGQPEAQLTPRLDELIGEVGLSPLDPVQPLARYEILMVRLHPRHKDVALVITRFVYADGSSRIYPVPLLRPTGSLAGFWLSGWMNDGLARLRSEHIALPGQPFATPASPIQLSPARQLPLAQAANRLDEVNPGHWLWTSVRVQHLVWAPDGSAFLAAMEVDAGLRQLWRIPLDGSEPVLVASADLREYGWAPDSQSIVYTSVDPDAAAANPGKPFAIVVAGAAPNSRRTVLVTGLETSQLPGLTDEGAWFFTDGALWVAPYSGGAARPALRDLAGLAPRGAPRPAPDGSVVVFACGADTCLTPVREGTSSAPADINRRAHHPMAEAAWTPDGSRVAVVERDPNSLRPVSLAILARDGREDLAAVVAPDEATEAPQWTPDGRAVFVQTYPQDGRRIIAVDVPGRQVLDLSQEHWDAYFALSPDGRSLLLNNGRGDFWLADVIRK